MLSDSSGARSEGGRLFQVAGPNTAKLRIYCCIIIIAVSTAAVCLIIPHFNFAVVFSVPVNSLLLGFS